MTPTLAATRSSTTSGTGSQLPAEIGTGDATAIGSEDANVVTQGAEITLEDQATANVIQVALILNVGVAFANSGYNGSARLLERAGLTAGITTGDASAEGLDIDQYITQAATRDGRRGHRRPRRSVRHQSVDGPGHGEQRAQRCNRLR